jgi:predicted metal-dependent TIM-barrel fold hydrolase
VAPSSLTAVCDAHLHPAGLPQQDLESLAFFGVRRAVAVAHPVAEPSARSVCAHFETLLEHELPRLRRAGIEAKAVLGVHPRGLPRRGLSEILSTLPSYFRGARVAAIGEVGLHHGGSHEEEVLGEQLALARQLNVPVLVHTPSRDKERLTRRLLVLLRASGLPPQRVLVDHATARTVRPILACGFFAGLSIHPESLPAERAAALVRRLGSERLVLNSDAGDAAGDLLGVPRVVSRMARARLSGRVISRVAFENAGQFFWDERP